MPRMHTRNGVNFIKRWKQRPTKERLFNVSFDPDADAAYVSFGRIDGVDHTEEVTPGILIDYDSKGNPAGVEILPGYLENR